MFAPIFSRKKPRQGVLASPLHQELAAGNQNVASRSHIGFGDGDAQYSNQSYSYAPQDHAGEMGRRCDGNQQTSSCNSWQQRADCAKGYMPQTGYATGGPTKIQVVPYSNQGKEKQNSIMTSHSGGQNFQFKRTTNNNKRLHPNGDNQSTAGIPPSQAGPTRPPKLMSVSNQLKSIVATPQQNKQWSQKAAGNYNNNAPWSFAAGVGQKNNPKPTQNNSRSCGQAASTSWNGGGANSEPVSWGKPVNQEFDLLAQSQPHPHQSVSEPDPPHANNFKDHSKESKASPETGIRIFPISVSTLMLRGKGFHHLPVMFEIIGQLDSAISRDDKTGKKNFQLRDESGAVRSSFFEIDRPLPRLTRGRWHRCIGHYDTSCQSLKCVSIRPAQESECRARKTATQQIESIVNKLSADLRET
ncbi:spermatogenesis-associated protein 22-like isoform X1 [Lineus longissimus]|uniref:spermatogenesis-associated protein 22-like isoform X1 n=1 Tax=Lineus longissimus TaxID=88925 RepID=UPI002B4F9622